MPRARRLCAEEVLRRLNLQNGSDSECDDADDLSEDTSTISMENNVTPDGDGQSESLSTHLHQEEELYNEASDDEFFENNSDVSDDSQHVDSDEDNFTSPSGIDWSSMSPPVRHLERNVIRFREGTTVNPANELQAFSLFINDTILRTIQRWTNKRLKLRKRRKMSFRELKSWFAVIIRSGADRDGMSQLSSHFSEKDSKPFYRCAMSKNRTKEILETISLDNKVTRAEKQTTDRLAAIREIWTLFLQALKLHYVPSDSLTVDEQLYGFRGFASGRCYMPAKPAKYGIKIFWICDASNGYALHGIPYAGKEGERAVGLAKRLVLELTKPFFHTHRNVYIDRYFTSHELIVELLKNGLTCTGTIMANRRSVPEVMKSTKGLEVRSTRFLWDVSNRIMLASYCPKKNKNVLLMSSFHQKNEIHASREDKLPVIIDDYNHGKGGVDVLDSCIEDFSVKRKTNRYTVVYLFNMIDVALFNAYTIMKANGYTCSRCTFMKKVAEQLAQENMFYRFHDKRIYAQTKDAFISFGFSPKSNVGYERNQSNPGKCQIKRCRKSTRNSCASCSKRVCGDHMMKLIKCNNCRPYE